MPNVPLVLGEAVMILGADRRALSAAFLAARLEGESTFSRIGAAASVAFLGITAGAAAAFGAATKGAAQLEKAISGAGAVAFATNSELAEMTQKSLDLSHAVNSVFKPTEIAGAMEVMIKAGLSLTDVMNGGAAAAVSLASAGGVDLETAGTFVARAMAIWGLETKDLTNLINHMAGAANLSTLDVNDLANAVTNAAATAQSAGTTVEDFFALTGITAKWFGSGAQLGTAYKNFINKLIPTTKAAREEMARLGFTYEENGKIYNKFFQGGDQEGVIKSAAEIVQVLNEALGDAPPAEIIQAMNAIFSPRGAGNRFALGLIKTTREEFVEFKEELAGMSAAEIAARRLDNAADAVTRFRRTVAALSMELASPLLPKIKRWAQQGAEELPRIFDALMEGLTGEVQPVRVLAPDEQQPVARDAPIRRDITSTSDEAAGRGMPGAGPSQWEVMAKRAGDFLRTQLLPRLSDFVNFIRQQILPALTDFAQHDIWPKLVTAGMIIGAVVVPAFQLLGAAIEPTIAFLADHKEILGALVAGYLTYVTVSTAVIVGTKLMAAAMFAYRNVMLGVLIVQGLLQGTLLVNPWSLLAVAVGALVVAGILLYKNWDRINKLFKDMDPVVKGLVLAVGSLVGVATAYILVARAAALAQWALNAAMLANPIGLVIIGVAGLVAAIILLMPEIRELEATIDRLTGGFLGASNASDDFAGGLRSGVWNAIKAVLGPLGALLNVISAVQFAMDKLGSTKPKMPAFGGGEGEAQTAPGGRITPEGLDTTGPEGEHAYLEPPGEDWRTAPPSNPNYQKPEEKLGKGQWRNPITGEIENILDEEDFAGLLGGSGGGDYEMGAAGEDEVATKKKAEDDRLQNAIDSLNDRFFQDLSEQLFKNPTASLQPLINKQGMIRAEISRTAQMLMDTLGVGLPEAFERASELVLERIDDMEKELEQGPKVSGFLGWLAAWSDNIKKFDVEPSQIKVGDQYTLNGGLHITPDPDASVSDYEQIGQTAWKQQKFAKQG